MNKLVSKVFADIEIGALGRFETFVRRPFVTVLLHDDTGEIAGVGNACVQLPDVGSGGSDLLPKSPVAKS